MGGQKLHYEGPRTLGPMRDPGHWLYSTVGEKTTDVWLEVKWSWQSSMNLCMGQVLAAQWHSGGVEVMENPITEPLFLNNGSFPAWLSLTDLKDHLKFAWADVWKFSGCLEPGRTRRHVLTRIYMHKYNVPRASSGASLGFLKRIYVGFVLPILQLRVTKISESVGCRTGHWEVNLRPKWASPPFSPWSLLHLPLNPQPKHRKTLTGWLHGGRGLIYS